MVYITGDTHGFKGMKRLNYEHFPQQEFMKKTDYVIVAGDFGMLWVGGKLEKSNLDKLAKKNFTILFVDGNHENFNMLNSYSIKEWNGGKVQFIRENVIHLMRGQVYTIEGKKFFTMGGAASIDKEWRIEGHSWWEQEIPSQKEFSEGIQNLSKYNNEVDYIITHDCSNKVVYRMYGDKVFPVYSREVNNYFDIIEKTIKFKHWYYGHHHETYVNIMPGITEVYEDVLKIF